MSNDLDPGLIWHPETQQQLYRELLQAMARPGKRRNLKKIIGSAPAWTAILATLVDAAVTFSNSDNILEKSELNLLRSHKVEPDKADYLLLEGSRKPGVEPRTGSLESPEFGATLILKLAAVGSGNQQIICQGPGIKSCQDLKIQGLHPEWWERRRLWNHLFPLGVDLILVDKESCVALPRTTQITISQ